MVHPLPLRLAWSSTSIYRRGVKMSFVVSLKNPPKEAAYWLPAIYYRNPVTSAYTPYYPEEKLMVGLNWLCPLSAGNGTMVDFRAVIYDASENIIDSKDVSGVVVADGQEFEYNWGGAGWRSFTPWLIGGVLAAAVVIVSTSRRKKSPVTR